MSPRFIAIGLALALLMVAGATVASGRPPGSSSSGSLTPHAPIYVNGDGNFTASNGVIGGSGTPLDPYLISGWWINVTSWVDRAAVILANTNASVLIEGLLVNVTAADPEIGSPNALNIMNSHNVTIRGVTTTGQNSLAFVDSSSHVTVANSTALNPRQLGVAPEVWIRQSEDVVVAGNILQGGYPGIEVWLSDHVQLVANEISGNSATGVGGVQIGFSSNVTVAGDRLFSSGIRASAVQDLAVAATVFQAGAGVYVVDGTRIAIEDNALNGGFVRLNYTRDSRIAGNENVSRIWLAYSPSWNTSIILNEVVGGDYGIYGWSANEVRVEGNNVSGMSEYGVVFVWAQNVTVASNRVSDSAIGILLSNSDEVLVFHNDFARNVRQVSLSLSTSLRWNETYPIGGNYWSDYAGVDQCNGPLQDICTAPDGIGDTPYVIDAQDEDYYPLIQFVGNDITPPTVTIAQPSDGASFTSSPIEVSGTASDEGGSGLREVSVRVNGGAWVVASGLATWNASIPLAAGANVIEARARDWTGNEATVAVNVTYAPTPPPNTAPYANFSWVPAAGNASTVFTFTSTSFDAQDPPASLQVRWDWESDGMWDTSWSTSATAAHRFATAGTYDVTMQVKDMGGLTASRTSLVVVTQSSSPTLAPVPALFVASAAVASVAAVVATMYLVLRSRKTRPPG